MNRPLETIHCDKCGLDFRKAAVRANRIRNQKCCTPEERFREKLKRTPSGCLEFQGCKDVWGYGQTAIAHRRVQAHRMAWQLANGPIPAGKHVLHRCNNRPCCNVEHLYLGDDFDNARDRIAAGTQCFGRPKLTEEQVKEIRRRFKRTGPKASNARELASQYGVSRQTVVFAAEGKTWRTI